MAVIWKEDILALQREDGSWGYFHSLGIPTQNNQITTEQAVRRLVELGMGREDEPIKRTLHYMRGVLAKEIVPPDRREGVLNWDYFEAMMMASWIKRLVPNDKEVENVAQFWAKIIEESIAEKGFDESGRYKKVYRKYVPRLGSHEREIGAAQFYLVTLLRGTLAPWAEEAYFSYILHRPAGIYYIYGKTIQSPPEEFASRETSRYLAALECLAGYSCAKDMLEFAVQWIRANQLSDGMWDLGPSSKDGVYLPLSSSWRTTEGRKKDCTARINRILKKLA